jgi:tRNA dimethylallyltransferase
MVDPLKSSILKMPSIEKSIVLNRASETQESQEPLIAIVGPTAVGKTQIAIQLAERLDGEIVSADSRLFYRGMDIGTAKPTHAEQQRVPHHLIDVADLDETWSLALFQQRARQVIGEIHARQRLPFLVGGTGQFLRAVTQGWEIPQVEPDPRLRLALEDWARQIGPDGLHARLAVLDKNAAERIDPRNLRRTVRALEVILLTGRRFSDQRQQGRPLYRLLVLGLACPRPELYARIDARIDAMLALGLVDEIRQLLARGYSPELPALSAIGYGEIVAYLQGKCSLEEAVAQIKRHTRIFVRRQANWFKPGDPSIRWFEVGPGIVEGMENSIRTFILPT